MSGVTPSDFGAVSSLEAATLSRWHPGPRTARLVIMARETNAQVPGYRV